VIRGESGERAARERERVSGNMHVVGGNRWHSGEDFMNLVGAPKSSGTDFLKIRSIAEEEYV